MTASEEPLTRPDPRTPLALELGAAVATAALTLVEPARLGTMGRFAYRTSQAGVTAVLAWWALGEQPELEYQPEKRVAIVAGAVGAVYAFAEISEALDAVVVRGLRRRRVRRPRLVMALAAAGMSLGLTALDRRLPSSTSTDEDATSVPQQRPLPEPVRQIVAAILEQTEDYDSLRLRAQLAVAGEEVWGEDDDFSRMRDLVVPDDVPLAVPHSFTFPVSARFVTPRAVPCTIELLVSEGRLSTILIDVAGVEWDELAEGWDDGGGDPDPLGDIDRWPTLEELTFVQETSGRPGPPAPATVS